MQPAPALLLPAEPLTGLDDYLAMGGGRALDLARHLGSDGVLAELHRSGLRGRGGGGFPTGKKWEAVRSDSCHERYVVCNAAEGEPGTFKDRWLLRTNPYQVLEGLAVAAVVVGATKAVVALKRTFAPEIGIVRESIAELDAAGLLGPVDVQVVLGPDEYLFGEEKALLEVIEGNEPLPRIFPPYQIGLHARRASTNPTLVQNVETLANIPVILRLRAERFRALGTGNSPGTKLFTVSGQVRRPGVYELPLGTRLRDLLDHVAGGPSGDHPLKAVFVGAGARPVARRYFDTPLDFESMRAIGSALGSGGVVAYDESACLVKVALELARFLWVESCAQCPACKQGAREIVEALERIENAAGTITDVQIAVTKCASVTGGSRCGLPAGTASVIGGVLDLFDQEIRDHLGRPCPCPEPTRLPKLIDYDLDSGRFTYDERYREKRPDWTYATGAKDGTGGESA